MPPRHHLGEYRRKRQAERTPEPFGGGGGGNLYRFVVQKHAARRLHWDFRLEWQGVLKSWAVPRGPSLNPADKRMAVHVEDHPIDYTYFEGVIPPDNYGAGNVIVWDLGVWTPLEEVESGLEKGKLLFELHGYKMRGVWTLVRTKADWLLMKKPDAYADAGAVWNETSVLSGLTVEGRSQPVDPAAWQIRLAKAHNLEPQSPPHGNFKPMLAASTPEPFTRPGWFFELKYDGFRMLAEREGAKVRLLYRRGATATDLYPELERALAAWPLGHCVVDGELVAHNAKGMPDFQALQSRALLQTASEITAASVRNPMALFVFDLLMLEHVDLRGLPLRTRKAYLRELVPSLGPIRYSDHVEAQGAALFSKVSDLGLEGIVAKKADSVYRAGRSQDWLKIPALLREVFVVVGYTLPQGSRVGLGALQLGQKKHGKLVYVGAVGTGFNDALLKDLAQQLAPMVRSDPPCSGNPPKDVMWVQPSLHCQVRYKEITADGLLRQAVFEGLVAAGKSKPLDAPTPKPVQAAERHVPISNPDKIFWPEEGYTKADLLTYYEAIAPWLLPYLRDRPLTLTRYPDGIHGKFFFQKDAPEWTPPWIRTVRQWSDSTQRDIDFFVCDDVPSLLYVINLGTIPIHIGSSRTTHPGQPDWCVLDLDPKEAPFAHVVRVARHLHGVCKKIGMPSFVKTTGSTGLHVMLPLQGALTHEQCRHLAELLARVVVDALSNIATVARPISARGGKVYVDTGQNGEGRLVVAPFSARPVPGALVSTPLSWREVTEKLDFHKFNIRTVPARFKRLSQDPLLKVLTTPVDIVKCLAALETLL